MTLAPKLPLALDGGCSSKRRGGDTWIASDVIWKENQRRESYSIPDNERRYPSLLCISRESNTGPIDGNDGFYH
ncbi:hypothetical protein B0T21DRAFT_372810 [Apiosordaria backusii]|uniref:Uncharacterized protein n=1 Tax=Apiosordaria backusii TaxID=314023 RepID=A0AA40AXP3_9PEZI|nr:hypothetical protein B0T21DRAFT_372810 [Apiosordaria backusii]